MAVFHDRRTGVVHAIPAVGQDRVRRAAKGAPLARGVRGRAEALGNMDRMGRIIAEAKTSARAAGNPTFRRQH